MKANWSFAPCTDETHLLVLASKIVGNTVAGQCLQESICDTDNAYKLDVLLLKPNAGKLILAYISGLTTDL